MLQLNQPGALFLLALLPVWWVLRRRGFLVPPALPLTMADWGGAAFSWRRGLYRVLLPLPGVLFAAAFVGAVLALAEPVLSTRERVYASKSAEIIFVIDVSPSMAAQDMGVTGTGVQRTRLDAAKQAIRLLTRIGGDGRFGDAAYGLVSLAAVAALVVPPTLDHGVFVDALDALVIGTLGDGTALGTGLTVALYHAESSSAPKKAIVLLTDGENNAGDVHPAPVARLAAVAGIPVYVLGIGTRGSVPLSYRDPVSGEVYRGFLDSRFDEGALREIALDGGGAYFGVQNLSDLESALATIGERTVVTSWWRENSVEKPLYQKALALAVAAAGLGWFVLRIVLREVL
jgi:Ca-activated chloride channel family protein